LANYRATMRISLDSIWSGISGNCLSHKRRRKRIRSAREQFSGIVHVTARSAASRTGRHAVPFPSNENACGSWPSRTIVKPLTGEPTLQPLALDIPQGRVWSYGDNTLKVFTFAGQLVRTVPVPPVSSVQLQMNALALPSTCTITPPELTCTPGTALPEGAVAVSATIADFAGNLSLPATRQITIDTTPPATPQSGRITVSAVTNGQVTVSGSAGSVEGSSQVRITNPRTGQITTVTANADGSFSAQVPAQPGDLLSVVVKDAAGNTSPAGQLPVGRPIDPVDVPFVSVWNGMNAALLAGNKAAALSFLTFGAQAKYGPVFDALLPHMAGIIASYSPLQRVSVSENVGEYAIIRTLDGANHLFLVYFVKSAEGVWKLDAM
jgi:enamine deaminase RidA (YjgF/YER057c/UK114 family)